MDDELRKAAQRKASFGATVKAILWAFFGVRKRSGYEQDTQHLNPVHVILAGVIGAAIFVAVLLIIVNSIV